MNKAMTTSLLSSPYSQPKQKGCNGSKLIVVTHFHFKYKEEKNG